MIRKLFHTLIYLRLIQIYYQIWNRVCIKLRKSIKLSPSLSIPKKGEHLLFLLPISKVNSALESNRFEFLNLSGYFSGSWNDETFGKLWAYNLNYMDYLLQSDMSKEVGLRWIHLFIEDIDSNKNGVEPYPIALRGINWIKFLSNHGIQDAGINASLYAQYRILENNLEYHLLGNHLLEDGFSMLIGALYFRDQQMYNKATKMVQKELNEQTLSDGGHFEQSPMYHCILLDRLLDCINALKNNSRFAKQNLFIKQFSEIASLWLGWLETIVYRDGMIPLLNDSAYGIAPLPKELFAYARRMHINWSKQTLHSSGYRKLESERMECILDVGDITASYQPGHTHADTFNYELRIDGKPFVIDTGISTYNKNTRRQYERETQAHNTVTVEDNSSSDVWGGFRVGKRASVKIIEEKEAGIMAEHNGFCSYGIVHRRTFRLGLSDFEIVDKLNEKNKVAEGVSRVILHPAIRIIYHQNGIIQTDTATITYDGELVSVGLTPVEVAFEYNKLVPTTAINFRFKNKMSYTIQL